MQVTKVLSTLQKNVSKNAPTILTVMGGVGVIASVCMASKSALDAKKALEERKQELQEEADDEVVEIPTKEKVAIYVKAYIPTAIMVAATEVCLYESNHINQKRLAAISAAYILKEANFKEYKQQVESIVGSKKAREIKDSLIQKHIDETPQTDQNTYTPLMRNMPQLSLWFDDVSKRYFYSNAEIIRNAEIDATAMLKKNGWVSLNDVYELLGIEGIDSRIGDTNGWDLKQTDEVTIVIDGGLSGRLNLFGGDELMGGSSVIGSDIPIGTISMEVHPSSMYMSEG